MSKLYIKRTLFSIAIVFLFFFEFVQHVQSQFMAIVVLALAGFKVGDYANMLSEKVFPEEEDKT